MSAIEQSFYRVYEAPAKDGYPAEWYALGACSGFGIKDYVRIFNEHRCERCKHPYLVRSGLGEWSPCDEHCQHGGPARYLLDSGEWSATSNPDTDALRMLVPLREVQAAWRILTVHHLNGVKLDCRWWNLAALCQRCHLYIQGKVRMEQVWPHEHSEWFKPHAAGYYASVYLGEELDRHQVAVRLDELLALERVT